MAEQQDRHQENADALKALAEGVDLSAEQLQELQQDPAAQQGAGDFDPLLVIGPTAVAAEASAVEIPNLPAEPLDRRAHFAAMAEKARHVHARQFKQVMIPLLVTMAAVLLLCGAGALWMLPAAEEPNVQVHTLLGTDMQKWLGIAAFPIAAILLAGAWLFRRDIRLAGKV